MSYTDLINLFLTAVIALAAVLTFLVYRRMSQLMARANAILEETKGISASMVEETAKGREQRFMPAVTATLGTYGGSKAQWTFWNDGAGVALNVNAYHETRAPQAIAGRLGVGDKGASMLPHDAEYVPEERPGVAPEPPALRLHVKYQDVLGRSYESVIDARRSTCEITLAEGEPDAHGR